MINQAEILAAKILIVDDQQSNIFLLEEMLHDAGYTNFDSTTDAHSVAGLYKKNHYDLMLLDLVMPGYDGFQVMQELKETDASGYLPILVITGQPNHKLRALAAGAKDFVTKPFDMVEVKTRIHNMLEVRLLYRHLENNNRKLESLALHDPLTGLPNRRLLLDRISQAIADAHREKLSMAVVFLDMDGFKQVNDTLGHDAGDRLLQAFSTRLLSTVRQIDTVARLGGDEFVIALWESGSYSNIESLLHKVMHAVSQPYDINGNIVSITVSAGIGVYPEHGESAELLIDSADFALYEAKHAGKNCMRFAAETRRPNLLKKWK